MCVATEMGGNEKENRILGTCNEAGRDRLYSEEGERAMHESGQYGKIDKRSDEVFRDVWMERFGHRHTEWIGGEDSEAHLKGIAWRIVKEC